MAHGVKNPPAEQETQKTRGFNPWLENIPWRRKMARHSSILAWRIPWTEESGGLKESQRVRHDRVTMHALGTFLPLPQGPSISSLRANFWKASLSQDTTIFWKIAILYLFFSKRETSSPICWKATIVHIEVYDAHTVNGTHGLCCAKPAESCGSPESGSYPLMTRLLQELSVPLHLWPFCFSHFFRACFGGCSRGFSGPSSWCMGSSMPCTGFSSCGTQA